MLAIFFSAGNAFSQSGEKYSVNGNFLNTGDVIGSKNAIDMVFITNNTKWMWLTKNGNLGIGKSKPFHKFEVAGRSRFIGNMYVDSVMFALSIEAAVLAKTASLLVMQNAVVNGTVTIGNALTLNGQASSITSVSGTITFLNNNISTTGNIKANLLTANGLSDGTNMTNVTELRSHLDNAGIHAPLNDEAVTTTNLWSASKISSELIQTANPDTVVANAVKTNSLFSNSNLYIQSDAGHGSTFFNVANNNKVCIGTNMTLPVRLLVTGSHDSTASIGIARYSNDTKGPLFVMMKSRGSQLIPLAVAQGDELGRVVYGGYDGVKFVKSDVLRARATEDYSPAGCGSSLEFTVTPNGNTSPVVALLLEQDQTAIFSNTIFTPKLSNGVPSPQAPLDVQGSAIVRGWLFVEDGVVVGKRFQGSAAEVDTLRPAPQSPQQAVAIPSAISRKIVSDTLRALKVKIETAVITKSSAEKLTADTLVTEKMTLQELTADTVTGQKVEAAQMVTDTMYSSKVQTDKIETTQEVKVGTEIVIDGTTGKITTSTINANNLAITGQASLSQLHVADSIKIGNSVWIGGINTNLPASYNHIYSDDGYLSVQCKKFDLNTIINAYNNGKVGIGTYNPKTKLDINGQVYIRNGNNAAVIYFPRTGNFPNFYIRSDDNPSTYEADRDRLFIGGEDGNVGIGTTSPGKKLDVSGTIRASNELISTSTGIAQARFICSNYGVIHRNDGTNYYILLTALNDPYGYWNTFRPFRINIASGNVYLGKNALTIEHSTGNIGVGTTTPKTRLHVKTDSTNIWMGTTQSHFVDGYNNGGAIYLGAAYGGTDMTCGIEASWGGVGFTTPQMGIGLIRGGVGPHILMKAPGGGSGAGIMSFKNGTTTNMIITPAGQVGIGTTCPDEKLCVNGIVKSNIEFIVTEYDGWCDFAFNKDYIRMNWKEKVKFYTDSLHLPGIDPGKKIETEGLKISKTMAGLMLNVEENRMDITDLYIMYEELKKEFDELKKENADLKRYIELKSKK